LLGEWLVHNGVITREQLLEALRLGQQHEWRVGDALVVLRFASRTDVETEAARFARHHGRCEPRRDGLERRARWMEREAEIRRITRAASGGGRPG
jgi:hypothetical protein